MQNPISGCQFSFLYKCRTVPIWIFPSLKTKNLQPPRDEVRTRYPIYIQIFLHWHSLTEKGRKVKNNLTVLGQT